MQILGVGIHADKGYAIDLRIYHMVYSIFSRTSDSDNHNASKTLYFLIYFWHNNTLSESQKKANPHTYV